MSTVRSPTGSRATSSTATPTPSPSRSSTTFSRTQRENALWTLARRDVGVYGWAAHGFKPAAHHQVWLDAVQDLLAGRTHRKLLIVAPPGHAKSSWLSLVFPAWYVGRHPDHSLLFFTSSDTMARQFGTTVKSTLEANERHALVFPDPAGRPDPDRGWSTDGLYLRATPHGAKDPAYRALGYGASVIGARAHGVILDDPLTQEQARSPVEQLKARQYHDMTVDSRLHPDGWAVAIMTRWHESDLAAHLAAKQGWAVLEMPALGYWGEGTALWPERFPADWLAEKQRDIGGPLFACLYQGNPTALGGEVFKASSWFRPLPGDFDRSRLTRVVQFWDLAFSERDTADYTVGLTLGRDGSGNLYVLGLYRARVGQAQLLNVIASQVNLFRPAVVGVEEAAYRAPVTKDVVGRLLRGGLPAHVQAVKPVADKVMRARLPAGRAEAGMLYCDRGAPWAETLIAECFPADTLIQAEGVTRVFRRSYTGDLVVITTPRGVIETTPEHPFWTPDGWMSAGALVEDSQLLYTPRDGSADEVQPRRIGEVVESYLADVDGRRRAGDGLDAARRRGTEGAPWAAWADDGRPAGAQEPVAVADAVGLSRRLDRWRRNGHGQARGVQVDGGRVDREHLEAADGLAPRGDPEPWRPHQDADDERDVAAALPVRDHRAGVGAAARSAVAVPGRQATADGVGARVLPSAVGTAQPRPVDGSAPPDRRGDPRAQYERVLSVTRRGVVGLPVFNIETASHTYRALGYLVHNCLGFPNTAHDDQVDALSGATQLALEWRAPREPVPVRFGDP